MEDGMAKKLSAADWADYLALYQQLNDRLGAQTWFSQGNWQIHFDYLNKENPSGVWLQLVRKNWFDAALHIETWLRNAQVESCTLTVALHIETSKEKHGISRNDFSKRLLEKEGVRIAGWPGYQINPSYAMEPLKAQVAFTRESLVDVLERELTRLQTLGDTIDETIAAVRH
jgi:hypothetical protein